MYITVAILLCSQLLIQSITAQCMGAPFAAAPIGPPCAGAWGAPYGTAEWAYAPAAALAASNGPGIAVSTASPLIPAGVSVLSNNAYEGILAVGGAAPFLGTVAIEGALPTAGVGAVSYGCGNGAIGITAEDLGTVGFDAIGVSAALPLAVEAVIPTTMGAPLSALPMTIPSMPIAPVAIAPRIETWDACDLAASNGRGVAVSTASPIVPAGVSVMSENAYEGSLAAGGALPFLGTVAIEGALPTVGAGAVAYGCGNGAIGITAEDMQATRFPGISEPLAYGTGLATPYAYGNGLAGPMGISRPFSDCSIIY